MNRKTYTASAPIPEEDEYNWSDEDSLPPKKAKKSAKLTQSQQYVSKRRKAYSRYCAKLKVLPKSRFLRQLGESHISMKNEFMKRKDINCICATLLSDTNFAHLDLSGNVLDRRSILYVVQLANGNKFLNHLILSECHLTSETLSILSEGLLSNKTLESLDLSGNNIRDEDGWKVADIIKYTKLRSLKLSHNKLQEKAAIEMGDAIGSNDTLLALDLSWNHLRNKAAECLAIGLVRNESLRTLDVSWNGFALEGCCALRKALQENTTLETLDLTCNRIHPKALNELLKGVVRNTTLLHLKLGHNPIGAMYTSTILTIIKDNPEISLESLDLSGIVTDSYFESVLESLQETREIKVFYDKHTATAKTPSSTISTMNQKLPDIDPRRVSIFEQKNKNIIDIFNKVYRDSETNITREEVENFMQKERLPLNPDSLDLVMSYFESEGQGDIGEHAAKIDFKELMQNQEKFKEQIDKQKSNKTVNHKQDNLKEEPLKLPKIV